MDIDEADFASHDEPPMMEPDLEELQAMIFDGVALAVDGCCVEPDGVCPHGSPSWLIALGLI